MRLAALRDRHATGPGWAFPSRVYSDGLTFVVGRPLPHAYLARHLEARAYREVADTPTQPGTYMWLGDESVEIVLRGFTDAKDPEGYGGPERIRVMLDRGVLFALERLGPPPAAPGTQTTIAPDLKHPPRLEPWPMAQLAGSRDVRRTWVPLARIPKVLRDAVVASEDRRFRSHWGLDLRGNARALVTNWRAGEVKQGASTITQQVARGLFLQREKTFDRKIREAIYALALETALSKDEILEMYLNSVYWGQGQGRGVAGAAEAASWYFDKPVESLTLNDAALLAGIIPGPNVYSPFKDPAAARQRRDGALANMVEAGVLDAKTAARARARPLDVKQGTTRTDQHPSFTDFAGTYLEQHVAKEAPRTWGLAILTTCDLVWQQDAEEGLRDGLADLDPRGIAHGERRPDRLEGSFVALDPASARVRAVVGGRAQVEGDFDRATVAHRQSGSSIKPIIYAAALEQKRGKDSTWTAASVVPNLRRTFQTDEGPWNPENSDAVYTPRITLARALARSANVATTNLVEAIGPAVAARVGARFGLDDLKPVLSIGLGSNEVTLLDLVNAYTVFPAGGVRREARPVRAAIDGRGKDLLDSPPAPTRAIKETTAAIMVGLLENVVTFGISNGLKTSYGFTRPVGGKTGTTNELKDAWFVGFTPNVTAGVWVGYDMPRSVGQMASGIALPVWARIMNRLLAGFPPVGFPEHANIVPVWIDGATGGKARADCPGPIIAPFIKGTEPKAFCSKDHEEDWAIIMLARARADSVRAANDSTYGPSQRDTTL